MDIIHTIEEIERLIDKKTKRRLTFKPPNAILLVAICETDFDLTVRFADRAIGDLAAAGFEEVWLGDFMPLRDGAHREPRLFGLYPEEFRVVTERSMYDQKPYG